jgi:hypothetical protein
MDSSADVGSFDASREQSLAQPLVLAFMATEHDLYSSNVSQQ